MNLNSQTENESRGSSNTSREGPKLPGKRPDLEALVSLRRIMRAADERSHDLGSQYGITVPQLLCLRKIVERGDVSVQQLAAELYLKPMIVSGIADLLETRQFVIRRRMPSDRMGGTIVPTEAGRKLVEKVPPQLHENLLEAFSNLSDEKQQALADALSEVVELLGVEDAGFSPILEIRPQLDRPVSPLASRRYAAGPTARTAAAGVPIR